MSEWISVEDGNPSETGEFIAGHIHSWADTVGRYYFDWRYDSWYDMQANHVFVTHYQQLPPRPANRGE